MFCKQNVGGIFFYVLSDIFPFILGFWFIWNGSRSFQIGKHENKATMKIKLGHILNIEQEINNLEEIGKLSYLLYFLFIKKSFIFCVE